MSGETGYIKRHVSLTIQRYAEQYPHFQNQYQRLQILDTLDSSHNFFVSFRFDGLTQNEGISEFFGIKVQQCLIWPFCSIRLYSTLFFVVFSDDAVAAPTAVNPHLSNI